MSPNEAIKTCFQKYFQFKGRAPRPEFWWFMLFSSLFGLIISHDIFYSSLPVEILTTLIGFVIFLPTISVTFRRLQDTNKPGYWSVPFFVLPFIPDSLLYRFNHVLVLVFAGLILVYILLMLYWLTLKSDEIENDYGVPPTMKSQIL